jgi:hypothetical protein
MAILATQQLRSALTHLGADCLLQSSSFVGQKAGLSKAAVRAAPVRVSLCLANGGPCSVDQQQRWAGRLQVLDRHQPGSQPLQPCTAMD